MLRILRQIAARAGDDEILGAVPAPERERDDVVDVVTVAYLLVAVVAATTLAAVLIAHISGGVCPPTAARPRSPATLIRAEAVGVECPPPALILGVSV